MKKIFYKLLILQAFFVFAFSFGQVAFADQHPDLCPILNRTMKIGTTGQDVKRLQVVLGQEGIAYLGATGYFGPATGRAVKIFQLRNGISQTGNVGPRTLAAMVQLWCTGGGSSPEPINVQPNSGYPSNYYPPGYNTSVPAPISNGPLDLNIFPISSTNDYVKLSWTSNNANTCNINGQTVDNIGTRSFQLTGQTDFTITCNGNGTQSITKTITIRPNQTISNLPNVRVSINPTSALVGTYATLYWTSTNTTSCNVTNGPGPIPQTYSGNNSVTVTAVGQQAYPNYNNQSTSGSQQIYVSGQNASYTVTCTGINGQSVSSSVTTNGAPPVAAGATSATISTTNPNINAGGSTNISWSSQNAASCSIVGGTAVYTGLNGSQTVYPTQTTTYVINCTSSVGTGGPSVTNQVTVYVAGSTIANVNADSYTDTQAYRSQIGQTITFNCPANLTLAQVWGTDIYSDNSSVCSSAIHAGKITQASGGQVSVLIGGPQNSFTASTRNGVTSITYGYWPGSFSFTGGTTNNGVILTANPTNITSSGQLVTLNWSATNVTSNTCSITANGSTLISNQNGSGSYTVYPTINTNYSITCTNTSGQQVSGSTYVTLNSGGGGNQVNVSANPSNITYAGQPATLTWNSSNVTSNSCMISANGSTIASNQYANGSYTVYPTISTNYTVTCTNTSGQQVTGTTYITLNGGGGSVTANISASQTYITAGQQVTLTWYSSGANSCSITGGNLNLTNQSTGGTYLVTPNAGTTYTVTCVNSSGQSATNNVYISVNGSQNTNVTATLSAYPTNITYSGQPVTLTWSATNASYCSLTANGNILINNQSTIGNYTVYPSISTNYVINCYNYNGQNGTNYAYVTFNGGGGNSPTVVVNPQSSNISAGQSQYLQLVTTNVNYCYVTGGIYNNQYIAPNGSMNVTPSVTTTYNFTCYGTNGTNVNTTATVSVGGTGGTGSVTVSPSSTTIISGTNTVLTLTKVNINTCTVNGGSYVNYNMGSANTITVNPTTTTTYTFSCTDTSGAIQTASSIVSIQTTSPQLTISPENQNITYGQQVTISISTQNIASCTIQGGVYTSPTSIGSVSSIIVTPTQTTTYMFSCLGNDNTTVTKSSIITVNSTPSITVTSPNMTITSGNTATLNIARVNTTACTISGGGYSNTPISNSTSTMNVAPTTTTTYTFNCTGPNSQTANASIMISVVAAPTITVTPYTQTISSGQVVTFTLNKTNITSCSINGTNIGGLSVWNVAPTTTTTYNFSCVGTTGATVATSSLIIVQ